ncbi:hypothetical protein ABRG53_1618 [Pseudanabaena sp. ABRG5-3]|nr:hypothetical protein ABRG53_1618 [Pseudanabaena sp. ABRG5-3]
MLSLSTIAKVFAANPRDLLVGVKTQPQAVQLLPKRSPLFLSFLVDPEKLGLFAQLAAQPSDRGDVRHELASLKQQLRQNWLLDYERDIQPWLAQEITLAVTDVDLDDQPANGLQTGYLLALAAKDVDLAKTTIDAFWQKLAVNGSDLGFEQYQGVSILNTSFSADKPAIAGTTLDKFVLFANDVRVLRQAIDALKSPNLALASVDNYRDRLAKINTGKVGIAYANLAELGEDLPKASLLSSLSFDKLGIRAKTLVTSEKVNSEKANGEKQSQSLETVAQSGSSLSAQTSRPKSKSNLNIATAIPSGSSVIIGNNLGETLQALKTSLPTEWQKVLAKAIAPIPLDSNAWAWAQDDFAIALLPNSKSPISNSQPDWLLVSKINDPKTSATAIATLDDIARKNLTVGEISLKAQPVTVWTNLSANVNNSSASANLSVSGQVVAAHAQTPNYIYLSNSLTGLESALTLKNNQAITASKNFKTITAKLPSDRQTYGYLDQNFDLTWLNGAEANFSGLQTSEILQKISNSPLVSIFNHLNIFSFASTGSQSNIENGEFFIFLK